MTINATEALDIQRVMYRWLDQSFVPNDPPTADDSGQHGPEVHDLRALVGQAKLHLNDMLVLDPMERRDYLTTRGYTQAAASRVFNLHSTWPDQQARNQVDILAQECISRDHGLDILLQRWSAHVDTQRLHHLLAEIEDTRFDLAISFATCRIADILNGAYHEAMDGFRRRSPKLPAPDDESLPLILHEPGQTVEQQLADLATVADGWNGPASKGLHPACSTWVKDKLGRHWSSDMPAPFVFPAESGGFSMEWFVGHAEHSLEVDFPSYVGKWEWWDSKTDQEHAETLDLNEESSWVKLHTCSRGRRTNR
jgi:hypothetical protein